jgi:hypothetical protein
VNRPQPGQGFGAEPAEKDTNGWIALRSAGPTPETLSRRVRLPKAPCCSRQATIRWAKAGPMRGNRVISLTSALSRSIRSPGRRGRESCAARRAVSISPPGGDLVADWSRTSPGGAPGEGERKYRTPAPARARPARRSAARLSSISVRGTAVRGTAVRRTSRVVRGTAVRGTAVRRTSRVVRGCCWWVLEKSPQHLHGPAEEIF